MKKVVLIAMVICMVWFMCSCGVEEQTVSLIYGETSVITLKGNPEGMTWESSNDGVVSVDDGKIAAMSPGEAVITARVNGKDKAVISVSVSLVDVTSIFVSQRTLDLKIGEEYELKYTLMPENASKYGVSWKTANEDVAVVSAEGVVTGIAPGTTTVICANLAGIMDTCEVIVEAPSAIEQLNEREKMLFDYMIENMMSGFYNASSVRIRKIYDNSTIDDLLCFILDIQGTNRLGGTTTKLYGVIYNAEDRTGVHLPCGDNPDLSHPVSSEIMDVARINAALEEYWANNHY